MELARLDSSTDTYPYGNETTSNGGFSYHALNLRISRGSYAVNPDVRVNLLMCRGSSDRVFAALATSKSGKRFYVTNDSSIREYTGSVDWRGTDYVAMCTSANSATPINAGAGL